jgi:hypothetical protein
VNSGGEASYGSEELQALLEQEIVDDGLVLIGDVGDQA